MIGPKIIGGQRHTEKRRLEKEDACGFALIPKEPLPFAS